MERQVIFRVDASLQIGSGHVMRCLTLASAMKANGASCHFICRAHSGNLIRFIREKGFSVSSLALTDSQPDSGLSTKDTGPAHTNWLGCSWQTDAEQTKQVLADKKYAWLIVDHYSLDSSWESALTDSFQHIMVIDDLADRPHFCDLLLDQNLGREATDYKSLVPEKCQLLIGPYFALLRPEFSDLREYSLCRRKHSRFKEVLVTMGGVDQSNATAKVLHVLKTCPLPDDCNIKIVMGSNAPWLQNINEIAVQMPWHTEVLVNISDMAQRMANSDLCIGAAGSTSWERCCLGLPALMLVLAKNQSSIAKALDLACAAKTITCGEQDNFEFQINKFFSDIAEEPHILSSMTIAAAEVTKGTGTFEVIEKIGAIGL